MDGELTRVIVNGIVAAPYGMFRAHVAIAGERIAAFSDDQVGAGFGRFLSGRDDHSLVGPGRVLAGQPSVTPSGPGTGP